VITATALHVIADSGVNTTVVAAFAVGFVSFISPCVLPLVPGYLSAISGVSFAELQEGENRRKVIVPALLFCLSFTVMFVALGMTATGIGKTLAEHRLLIRHIAGIIIFAMGALFIGTLFMPLLNREWRPEMLLSRASTGGPVIAGLAFAVAWLPCTGPTLGAILTAASTQATVAKGGVLLAFYSLGLGVPFVLSAVAFSRVTGFFRFFRDHYAAITLVSGVILMAMGVLLFTDELTRLNNQALTWLDDLGLNFFSNI
jgi:cytochrome c-type biogenesis protein